MVKKLFKHEVYALWRLMCPFWGVLFGVAILGRLVQLFEQPTTAYSIVNGSAIVFYVITLTACIVCPFVFATTRFYRNLFKGEGYLTLTLPVTTDQHILVKLAVAVMTELATLVVVSLSVALITFGDVMVEIGKAIGYILKYFSNMWGAHLPLYIAEGVIGLIVLFAMETLLFYTCICIGQQSKKNRVLAAVGAYFGIYVVQQIFGTIMVLIGIQIDWEPLGVWIIEHSYTTAHIIMCGIIVVCLLIGGLFYWVSRQLMMHRLNLE